MKHKGSVTIGNFVIIGGQTGIKDHITIGDNVKIAAKSGVTSNLSANMDYGNSRILHLITTY